MNSICEKDVSAVKEIFRFIQKNHDNPEENAVRDLYDSINLSYDEVGVSFHNLSTAAAQGVLYSAPKKVIAILNEYCSNKDVSILECGAGTGLIGEKLYESGYKNTIGVDFSRKSLDVAEEKGVYKKLVCAEIVPEGMPFRDDEFDILICTGCIAPGHISPRCFPEWTRIVKPGGYVLLLLRKCYVEHQKGLEAFYSKSLGDSFQAEIRKLEISKKWEVVMRQIFPGYVYEGGILSDGVAVVCKVI
ncbi:Methyltransferase-like protein 27 [Holothuria leucospilota]|uniref:Methyltransferase-like protein 27 n=1 Tax=Holothuria leucospilota TaxID=206669 RepID=A0A9Q1H4Z9_HOLLE|nr:Methyltransferase-like protein 27 [Holothuria leucospilota]